MDKVSIKLQGGMANYLFQIACAAAYSLKHGKELYLTEEDSVVVHKHISNYKNTILHNVQFSKPELVQWNHFNENGFHYSEIPFIEGNVYLNGYHQSEKYFKEYENEIKKLFSFPTKYIEEIKNKYENLLKQNTCSIHVRLGDYVSQPQYHPVQSINYYMKAVRQMPKDSVFIIFSDDIKWCKGNFPNIQEKFIFIEGNDDIEDFCLMSLCKNNIICNSTFSWWAAWLNNNKDKKIISCSNKNWFGSAYSHYNTSDVIPESWTQI